MTALLGLAHLGQREVVADPGGDVPAALGGCRLDARFLFRGNGDLDALRARVRRRFAAHGASVAGISMCIAMRSSRVYCYVCQTSPAGVAKRRRHPGPYQRRRRP